MRQVLTSLALVAGVFYCNIGKILAHGPLHEAIVKLTEAIEQHPDSVLLYFERGALYQMDENFDNALADFEQVLRLNPSVHTAIYQLAKINFKIGKFSPSNEYINTYINLHPNDAPAFQLRGELYNSQRKTVSAIPDFRKVIELKKEKIVPEDILQLSHLLKIQHPEQTIQLLEYGLRQLPANIILQSHLIDLTIANGQYEKAFGYVNQVLVTAPRKELWLLKKAEIYEAVGDCEQARIMYQNSLAEIASLKIKSKQTEFVKNIRQQALVAIEYL